MFSGAEMITRGLPLDFGQGREVFGLALSSLEVYSASTKCDAASINQKYAG